MSVTKDDFEAWLANPVTEYVMRAMGAARDGVKADWIAHSWDGGSCDPLTLERLRTRADTLEGFTVLEYEAVQSLNGDSTEDADNE